MDIRNVKVENAEATPYEILIPSFMISELRRAFEIGFLIFIPFLVIDLLIASILSMAMGMMMLPPVIISLPFKICFSASCWSMAGICWQVAWCDRLGRYNFYFGRRGY